MDPPVPEAALPGPALSRAENEFDPGTLYRRGVTVTSSQCSVVF